MLSAALALLYSIPSFAIVMPPMLNAADTLGYNVAGEIEFTNHSVTPAAQDLRESLNTIREICPRTQAAKSPVSKWTHVVVLAWSDHEFPQGSEPDRLRDLTLAEQRALRVAAALRRGLRGPTSFDLVNMASKRPHNVKSTGHTDVIGSHYDIKAALKSAGAAPSGRLEMGLFGEFAQKSKAVIWVECTESFNTRPLALGQDRRLAKDTTFEDTAQMLLAQR